MLDGNMPCGLLVCLSWCPYLFKRATRLQFGRAANTALRYLWLCGISFPPSGYNTNAATHCVPTSATIIKQYASHNADLRPNANSVA